MSTTAVVAAEQRIVLRDATCETYERLLADRGEAPVPRLTFDRGVLEIMSPGKQHETLGRLVTQLIVVVAEVWNLDVADLGSTTFKRADWQRGFEPDVCLDVARVPPTCGRPTSGTACTTPHPTSSSRSTSRDRGWASASCSRSSASARCGVDGERMAIAVLHGGSYQPAPASRALPLLIADALTELLDARAGMTLPTWVRRVRDWAGRASDGAS